MGENEAARGKHPVQVERKSELELVVTRRFDAPVRIVYAAWTTPELFQRWWAPKSTGMTILACEMDVRTGGGYRLEFGHPASDQPFSFFGRYVEVVPGERLVWTNEESDDGSLTTVTFAEADGATVVTMLERYPNAEALEEACAGMEGGMPETFAQLDALLPELFGG